MHFQNITHYLSQSNQIPRNLPKNGIFKVKKCLFFRNQIVFDWVFFPERNCKMQTNINGALITIKY